MLAELPCLRVTTYPWDAVLPFVPGGTGHDLKEGKVQPQAPTKCRSLSWPLPYIGSHNHSSNPMGLCYCLPFLQIRKLWLLKFSAES